MAITVGSLLIALGLDSAEFKSGLSQAEKEFKRSTKRLEAIGNGMADLGKKMSLAITAPIIALGVTSIKAAAESKAAIGQVEAALASMGTAAGKTSKQLQELAAGQMRQSLYDDDEILQQITANLLTFGNIAGSAFDRAQQAAIDLSARLGQDLQSSALMVGKALNDPVNGLSALRRVGIQFTEQQKEQIKAMAEVGNTAGAQAIMLKELERQFGGAAKAARDANPMAVLQQSFAQFQETVGEKLLPLLPRITDAITKVLYAFGKLSPGMQEALIIAAGLAAAFGPLLIVIGSVTTALAPFVAGIKLATTTAVAAGVATTTLGTSLAVLRAALLTATVALWPWVLGLSALAAVVWLVTQRYDASAQAASEYRDEQERLKQVQERSAIVAQQLATATGQARVEALANAKALRQETIQYLANAKAALQAARAKALAVVSENRAAILQASQSTRGAGGGIDPVITQQGRNRNRFDLATARLAEANQQVLSLSAEVVRLDNIINAPVPSVGSAPAGSEGSEGSSRAVPTGPTAAEIERRFNSELLGFAQQSLSAKQQLATSSEERAELEMRGVEWARRQTLEQIEADEDYSKAQKEELAAAVERLADLERQGIERALAMDLEQQRNELARIEFDAQREQLALAGDMADTQADRKRIALDILELEQEYRRNQLEMVLASETASDAEKARAQAILDSLAAIEKGERASVGRSNETELEAFLRGYNRSPQQMSEAVTGVGLDGLDRLTDGLANVVAEVESVNDAFRAMRDVLKSAVQEMIRDLARLAIQKAIAFGLDLALGGGGSVSKAAGTGGTGALKGFARGTNFAPGGLAIVGERGPELVNLPRGSQVIPNHELRGAAAPALQLAFHNDFRGADPSSVAAIQGRLDRMERELPGRVVSIYQDARSRFVIRN